MLKWEQISDEILAFCDLKEDPMFSKIDDIGFYIRESFAIAEKTVKQYENQNLTAMLQQSNVKIYYHENTNQNEMTFSEIQSQLYYDKKCKMIDIYLPGIQKKMDALNQYGFQITLEELLEIHMAHEFYHFYEFEQDKRTYEILPKVNRKIMHVINKKSAVLKCSEIAAHRFAKIITKAPLHPKLMDYMCLIEKGVYGENEVFQFFLDAEESLRGGTR